MRVEVLTGTRQSSPTAKLMLNALVIAAREDGHEVITPQGYTGWGDVLVLYGYGAEDRNVARHQHIASGRRVLMWDLGYFQRQKITGYLRCTVDHDHPQRLLDRAPDDASRWDALKIDLREDADPNGAVILVGLGRKTVAYLRRNDWESRKLRELRERFPSRRIVYRPKPGQGSQPLACETDATTPIAGLLAGASLVVCRHSNVAVDAVVAGVPFEAEDGAACWLNGKPYTWDNRKAFLQRLAWFQWRVDEAPRAWQFAKGLL